MSDHDGQCGSQPDANPEQQHSQAFGPWKADGITYPDGYFFESHVMDGRSVVAFARSMDEATCKRIAHMAAAATDMFAALKEAELAEAALINEWADFWDVAPQTLVDALMKAQGLRNAALDKATGVSR